MNREEAKQLLPVITAFANGEQIQYQAVPNCPWELVNHNLSFTDDPSCYRIKPKALKYRRALMLGVSKIQYIHITYPHSDWIIVENHKDFVKWIDNDWIEAE